MRARSLVFAVALAIVACNGSPVQPGGNGGSGGGGNGGGGGGGPVNPPANALPVVDSIAVQGTRPHEPANFADAGETVPVSAKVHDDETAADQLTYAWTATAGSFTGTGANVTWVAPATVSSPADVTITLTVTEKYGTTNQFEHSATGTAHVALHDSLKEFGDMARQFLLDFSDSNIRDVGYVMRNFNRAKCPDPREVDNETDDVANNRAKYRILNSRIGPASVSINFAGHCPFRNKAGDGCAVVPSYWDATEIGGGSRGAVDGNDIVAGVFVPSDNRWWLCASDYDGHTAFGATLRSFIR